MKSGRNFFVVRDRHEEVGSVVLPAFLRLQYENETVNLEAQMLVENRTKMNILTNFKTTRRNRMRRSKITKTALFIENFITCPVSN